MVGTLEQMLADMENGVYDFTDDGKCSNCGQCCTDILPMSRGEIQRIRDYIRKHQIKEQKHFVPTAVPVIDWTCPFRNNSERKCMIYEVRPEICRDFQCNKPKEHIEASKKLFAETRRTVSVRQTFFKEK